MSRERWLELRDEIAEELDRMLVRLRRSGNLTGDLDTHAGSPYLECANRLADLATAKMEEAANEP